MAVKLRLFAGYLLTQFCNEPFQFRVNFIHALQVQISGFRAWFEDPHNAGEQMLRPEEVSLAHFCALNIGCVFHAVTNQPRDTRQQDG